MTKQYEKRVAKGAALLDEQKPGWWNGKKKASIDLGVLNLGLPCLCILGQLYPSTNRYFGSGFNTGRRELDLTWKDCVTRGFIVDVEDKEQQHYGALRQRWLELIRARRK